MANSDGCKSNKSDIYKNIGIAGALVTIALLLKKAFKNPKKLPPIAKEEILIGVKFREGLSYIDIASKIIERKKEIGINITPLPSGAENVDLKMEAIRVEETVKAIQTNMKIEAAFPPGVPIIATGGNAGGPIVVQGATTQSVKVEGIAR
jgi:hypothetical protein